MEGWIKIHRKIQKWEWYQDSQTVHLFIHLLLTANHEPGRWQGVGIKEGQLITGLHKLSEATNISIKAIRLRLGRLTVSGEITVETTNRFSVITLCNYADYQVNDTAEGKQRANEGQTKGNKQEGKEVKEVKKKLTPKRKLEEVKKQYREWYNESTNPVYRKFLEWLFNEGETIEVLLLMDGQLDYDKFKKARQKAGGGSNTEAVFQNTIQRMANWDGIAKKKSFYLTLTTWLGKDSNK